MVYERLGLHSLRKCRRPCGLCAGDERTVRVPPRKDIASPHAQKRKTKTYRDERRAHLAAWVTADFEAEFGVTAHRLEAWQRLCRHLAVADGRVLGSIAECNAALTGTFLNIVDLVDSLKTKTRPKIFGSTQELAKYIQRTGKVFPLSKAKTSPLLSKFLIRVGPSPGRKKRKNKAKTSTLVLLHDLP
ncbi:hypothetical protein BD413DRAFT_608604 [Trametes elegans]|nr:hypothetical protein BD413DRAFT_608604 [Trametes elegans]